MTKVRILMQTVALFLLALPSCTSSAPAGPANSFVRQTPSTERPLPESRPLPAVPTPAWRPASAPSAPHPSAAPQDAQMKTIADQVQVGNPFPWRYVVIHHSASDSGDAQSFAQEHKKRGWDGLGYDFVIGNGSQSGDGQIEVGYRWRQQAQGAHAGSYQFNRYGIGICLVGNFDHTHPSARQLASLERLVAILMSRFKIPPANILGHGDVRQTRCPGRLCPMHSIVAAASLLEKQFTPPRGAIAAEPPVNSPDTGQGSADSTRTPETYPYH